MFVIKNRILVVIVSIFLFTWSGVLGCGTRSQIKVQQEETEPTLEMAQAVQQESISLTGSVSLEWNASAGADITGYKIYYGTSGGDYDTDIDVGNYTSVTITGLDENQTYYFAATAYDGDNNESSFSNEVFYSFGDSQPASSDAMSGILFLLLED
jgi:fibronectin type 3 domain-containing protein